jgi:hypothetical protein
MPHHISWSETLSAGQIEVTVCYEDGTVYDANQGCGVCSLRSWLEDIDR